MAHGIAVALVPSPLADAGPGPLIIPVMGSVAVAGVFLVLAAVSGGFYYLRRTEAGAASWQKWALILAGVAVIASSLGFGIIAWFMANGWLAGIIALVAVIAAGIGLIRKGITVSRKTTNDQPPLDD
jgi:hypothetical protein